MVLNSVSHQAMMAVMVDHGALRSAAVAPAIVAMSAGKVVGQRGVEPRVAGAEVKRPERPRALAEPFVPVRCQLRSGASQTSSRLAATDARLPGGATARLSNASIDAHRNGAAARYETARESSSAPEPVIAPLT